jgi:hypothetical protein
MVLSCCERLCEIFDILSVQGYVGFYVGVTHNRTLKIRSILSILRATFRILIVILLALPARYMGARLPIYQA